jgi:hypothetical protein
MKRIVLSLIFVFIWEADIYLQTPFTRVYENAEKNASIIYLAEYQNIIYSLIHIYSNGSTEINKLDKDGNLIRKIKFPWLKHYSASSGGTQRLMIDKKGGIFISGVYENRHGLLKLNSNLDSLWFRSYELPEATFLVDVSMTETKEYIVLQGQAQYNFSPVFSAHLIWLDKEGNLDTMIVHKEVNEIGNIKQGRIKTDKDDNIVFVYGRLFHNPNFPLWHQVYKGVLKYDNEKRVIWQWESKNIIDEKITCDFVFDSDNNIIFSDVGKNFNSADPFLTCLSEDSILWRLPLSLQGPDVKGILGIENYRGNKIVVYGFHGFVNINTKVNYHGFVSVILEKGELLWERSFVDYMEAEDFDPSDPSKYYTHFSLFGSFTFDKENSIYLGGSNYKIYPNTDVENPWLVKLDSFGCLNQDRCNEINETRPIVFIRFYDQIPILQKNMVYANKKNDGSLGMYKLSFGKDTTAFDQRYGKYFFREVRYENMDTGEKIKDHRRTRWWNSDGRMSFATKNNPRPEHLHWTFQDLYDFTLEVGDSFELPDSFGTATVISTDTFYLKDGAARKRITLRHNDEIFHQTHGDLVWVEGIGNINGSFFYQDDWKSGQTTELLCYFDRDQKRYYSPNSVDCLLSSTDDENQAFSLMVFPNPAYQQISYISEQTLSKIEITDITGRMLLSQKQDSGEVEVSFLTAGVYFLHFYTQNGQVIAKKLVKL